MREEHSEIKISRGDILRMTADVVAAYVGNNPLPATQIPEVINTVYGSLRKINVVTRTGGDEPPKAAVPVRESNTPDYLVCLQAGKKLKMLKRHPRPVHNLTPDTKTGKAAVRE